MLDWFRTHLFRRQVEFVLLLTLFGGSVYVLGWSSFLTIKKIEVQGAPTTSDRALISTSVTLGDRLARVDTRAVANSLKKFSWLKSAQVDRNWLKGLIVIKVQARAPLAKVGDYFIDSEGVTFTLPHKEKYQVPLILADSQQSKTFAATLLNTLPESFRINVEVVSVEGLQTATLLIKKDIQKGTSELSVRWGDSTNSSLKLRVYQSLLALPENSAIVFMDLSAPHAPIVR